MSLQEGGRTGVVDSETEEPYVVSCCECLGEFDASSAPWCPCVSDEPSLVCPACGSCFCKSSPAYKQYFWRGAPRSLQSRVGSAYYFSAPAASTGMPGSDRALVLVVDDCPVARRAAAEAIRRLGYNVLVACDGVEGLEMVRRHRPHLVLTDAFMPRMDGREMCRRIKVDRDTRDTRVFVMTALYTNPRYRTEAFKTFKADGYIEKPFAVVDLCRLLEAELEQRTA
jgi:CheY-like chemotaxis protein